MRILVVMASNFISKFSLLKLWRDAITTEYWRLRVLRDDGRGERTTSTFDNHKFLKKDFVSWDS